MYTIRVMHGMNGPLVRISGRVDDGAVAELLEPCRPDAKVVRIDLRDLISASDGVLRTLHALERSGAAILNAPRHVRVGLDQVAQPMSRWSTIHDGAGLNEETTMTNRVSVSRPVSSVRRLIALLGLVSAMSISPALAQQGPTTDRFTLDLGGLVASLSSDLRVDVTNGRTGSDFSVEPTLGLDKRKGTFEAEAVFWITRKQRLSANFVNIERSAEGHTLDRTIQIGDKTLTINSSIDSFFNTRYLGGAYGYSFLKSPNQELGALIGLVAERFQTGTAISVSAGNQAVDAGRDVDVTAPVPEIGGFWAWHVGGNVTVGADAAFFKANVIDLDIGHASAHLNVIWRPWKNFGFGGGMVFNRLTIEGERGSFTGRAQSGFNGPRVFVQIGG